MKNFDESIRTDSLQKVARKKLAAQRHGLASLEMVLVLPFLMMLMATFIVFGYAASWKLRTETASRNVVWRDRSERFANRDFVPAEWTDPARMSTRDGRSVESYRGDDALIHPIIAGPLPAISVDADLLDFTRDVRVGEARMIRQPPLFAGLTTYDFNVDHPILDDRFQYRTMGIGNFSRRFPVIYETGMDGIRSSVAIANAVQRILNSFFWPRLEALDRDSEFFAAQGSAPDFYPRASVFASTDRQLVSDFILAPLRDRIRRVPSRMGQATIRLYQSQLKDRPELQSTIDAIRAWLARDDDAGGRP